MTSLNDQRDELIARIKAVFPKNPPGKWKYEFKVANRDDFEGKNLEQTLGGKRWETVTDLYMLIPFFTDVDYLFAFTNKALRYYLPAFLVASLKLRLYPDSYHRLLDELWRMREKFSLEELEILIASLNVLREDCGGDYLTDDLETAVFRLMFYVEERQK